ncbi:MAG: hypothetical protein LIO79_08195 [Rikenellaceae bacterium]|nr:hypothetical protein [Rikenellaceae bacterium]
MNIRNKLRGGLELCTLIASNSQCNSVDQIYDSVPAIDIAMPLPNFVADAVLVNGVNLS